MSLTHNLYLSLQFTTFAKNILTTKKMNAQLNELYHTIYQNEENLQPLAFIALTQPVIDAIVATDLSSNLDFPKATQLLTDYGKHLANTGKFHSAIKYLTVAAQLFENDKRTKGKPISHTPLYETILLYRGVAYYNSRKFKKARVDLKRLVFSFPQNMKYKNWFNKTISREMGIYQVSILIFLGISAIFYFTHKNEQSYLATISYSAMVGCIVCSLVVDIIKRRRKVK